MPEQKITSNPRFLRDMLAELFQKHFPNSEITSMFNNAPTNLQAEFPIGKPSKEAVEQALKSIDLATRQQASKGTDMLQKLFDPEMKRMYDTVVNSAQLAKRNKSWKKILDDHNIANIEKGGKLWAEERYVDPSGKLQIGLKDLSDFSFDDFKGWLGY